MTARLNATALQPGPRGQLMHARVHAVSAALRKAAMLERLDPRGDAYGAAGQALEDFVKREHQLVANGEDVRGWIGTVTERRWINELRYQQRRNFVRLDAPVVGDAGSTLGDLTAAPGLGVADTLELRERLGTIAVEQRDAIALLRAHGVQERHVRIVELALTHDLMHCEIARIVNAEFAAPDVGEVAPNTVTQTIGRLRDRLDDSGLFPTVVARLRRTRRAA